MCKVCNNTGSATPGYLDCVHCPAAEIAAALGVWLASHPNAAPLEIFQHGRDVERTARAAADSLPKIKEGSPAPKPDAWKYRAIGSGEWRVTLSEDWARALNDPSVVPLFAGAAPASQAAAPADAPISEHNARFAIDGAIQFGRENRNPPPSTDHWLYEYWNIGRQLATLGATGWDNVTPLALAGAAPVEAASPWQRFSYPTKPGVYLVALDPGLHGLRTDRAMEAQYGELTNGWTVRECGVVVHVTGYVKAWMELPAIPAAPAPEAQ